MKEGWTYKQLGEIATFITGSRPSGGVRAITHGVLSLGGEHIGRNGYLDLSSPKYVSEQFYNDNPNGHLKSEDILLCKDGALSGKVALERNELQNIPAMINEHVFIIRTDSLYQPYLFSYLFSPIGQSELKSRITGAAQGGINRANLKTIVIPIPPMAEQEQIVAELDLLSGIIEKKKEQLKAYDQLAQSIFYDMFGELITNEKGWKKEKLKTICSKITDGTHDTPERLNNGVKFITGKHIRPFFIDYENSDYVTEEVHKEIFLRCNPELGDVLYTNIGAGIGNAALNTVEYEFSMKNVALIKPKKSVVNGYFIEYYLNDEDIKSIIIDNYSNGGAQKFLSLKSIAKIPIFVPPLSLQEEFAEKVEAIERQKALVQQSIEETQTMFDCTMDKYFG